MLLAMLCGHLTTKHCVKEKKVFLIENNFNALLLPLPTLLHTL